MAMPGEGALQQDWAAQESLTAALHCAKAGFPPVLVVPFLLGWGNFPME